MNRTCRSHAIFTIYLETIQPTINGPAQRFLSQLNFVDLAPSQRLSLKNTSEFGDRHQEGIFIQSGLLALETLIHSYSNTESHHVSLLTKFICSRDHLEIPNLLGYCKVLLGIVVV
jgi:hypothetical protein